MSNEKESTKQKKKLVTVKKRYFSPEKLKSVKAESMDKAVEKIKGAK